VKAGDVKGGFEYGLVGDGSDKVNVNASITVKVGPRLLQFLRPKGRLRFNIIGKVAWARMVKGKAI